MAPITLTLATGREVSFDVDLRRDGPAVFALSVRRSGSSMFSHIARALAIANGRQWVDTGRFFQEDVPAIEWQSDPALHQLVAPGNVYGVFRDMPLALLDNELFLAGPRLMLVRDPRDALVSEYFAMAYSHPVPPVARGPRGITRVIEDQRALAHAEPIDEFVLRRSQVMTKTLMRYRPIVNAGTTVFHYEDVITRKAEWITSMLATLGWSVHDDELAEILAAVDVHPEREDPREFIRKVTPGDHLEKLLPETIERITGVLEPAMALFNYPT